MTRGSNDMRFRGLIGPSFVVSQIFVMEIFHRISHDHRKNMAICGTVRWCQGSWGLGMCLSSLPLRG